MAAGEGVSAGQLRSVEAIPVVIVAGYLGSGKSTLIRHALTHLPRPQPPTKDSPRGWSGVVVPSKVALIVNDFSHFNVDGAQWRGDDGQSAGTTTSVLLADIQEISGGCICCSKRGEFIKALEASVRSLDAQQRRGSPQLLDGDGGTEPSWHASPAGIIVETTGLADVQFAVHAVLKSELFAHGQIRIANIVVVLDAPAFWRASDAAAAPLRVSQVLSATTLVLNKMDRCDTTSRVDGTIADRVANQLRQLQLRCAPLAGEAAIAGTQPPLDAGDLTHRCRHLAIVETQFGSLPAELFWASPFDVDRFRSCHPPNDDDDDDGPTEADMYGFSTFTLFSRSPLTVPLSTLLSAMATGTPLTGACRSKGYFKAIDDLLPQVRGQTASGRAAWYSWQSVDRQFEYREVLLDEPGAEVAFTLALDKWVEATMSRHQDERGFVAMDLSKRINDSDRALLGPSHGVQMVIVFIGTTLSDAARRTIAASLGPLLGRAP